MERRGKSDIHNISYVTSNWYCKAWQVASLTWSVGEWSTLVTTEQEVSSMDSFTLD